MPLFYFDVVGPNGLERDETGLELTDLKAARREARVALREMVRDLDAEDRWSTLAIHIRDHTDGPKVVRITLSEDPALIASAVTSR